MLPQRLVPGHKISRCRQASCMANKERKGRQAKAGQPLHKYVSKIRGVVPRVSVPQTILVMLHKKKPWLVGFFTFVSRKT